MFRRLLKLYAKCFGRETTRRSAEQNKSQSCHGRPAFRDGIMVA